MSVLWWRSDIVDDLLCRLSMTSEEQNYAYDCSFRQITSVRSSQLARSSDSRYNGSNNPRSADTVHLTVSKFAAGVVHCGAHAGGNNSVPISVQHGGVMHCIEYCCSIVIVCRVLCAEAVCATASDGFL